MSEFQTTVVSFQPVLALTPDPERCERFQRISSAFLSKQGIFSFWLRAHALNWVIFSSINEVSAEFPRTDPQCQESICQHCFQQNFAHYAPLNPGRKFRGCAKLVSDPTKCRFFRWKNWPGKYVFFELWSTIPSQTYTLTPIIVTRGCGLWLSNQTILLLLC